MNRKKRIVIGCFLVVSAVSLIGCGAVHSTDGPSVWVLGLGHVKDGKTNTQAGWGSKSNGSADTPRFGAFDSHPPQGSAAMNFGGNK